MFGKGKMAKYNAFFHPAFINIENAGRFEVYVEL
jgi:hypothetical protein